MYPDFVRNKSYLIYIIFETIITVSGTENIHISAEIICQKNSPSLGIKSGLVSVKST